MRKESYEKKTPFAMAILFHLIEKDNTRATVVELLDRYSLKIVETKFDPYFDLQPIKRG